MVQSADIPDEASLSQWANAGWQQPHDSEVTIRIVDAEESAQLNSRYRGKDGPTNVLSFPFEAPAGITVPLAGDLIICVPVVTAEARQQGKSLAAHWAHMVVHGMLHLQGFDHINDTDAEVMEALEIKLLEQLGFCNPYATEEIVQGS
nr:rRNA maturation RNase YbeY [Marinobacter sp. X15-166B]